MSMTDIEQIAAECGAVIGYTGPGGELAEAAFSRKGLHEFARRLAAGQQGAFDEQLDTLILQYGNARAVENRPGTWQQQKDAKDASADAYIKVREHLLATPQPPKPAGAVPIPTIRAYAEIRGTDEPDVFEEHLWAWMKGMPVPEGENITLFCALGDAIRYGDAREAAAKVWAGCTTCENWRAASAENAEKLAAAHARIAELEAAGRADAVPTQMADELMDWANHPLNGLTPMRIADLEAFADRLRAPQQMTTQGEAADDLIESLRLTITACNAPCFTDKAEQEISWAAVSFMQSKGPQLLARLTGSQP